MQTTRTRSTPRRGAFCRTAPWLCAALLAALPGVAQGQSPTTNTLRLTSPVVSVQPSLSLANPSLTVQPTTIQPALPGAIRATPGITANTLPTVDSSRIAPGVATPETSITGRPQVGVATAATSGLGRLVAPGSEDSSVVVARIGSAAHADIPALTADFDGDGLINFEIAAGIVDVAAESAGQDGGTLGGLVGRLVTMATGTADRVLDGVINTDGIVAATTFEIHDGAVVLGGARTTAPAVAVDIPRVPDGPANGDPGPGEGRTQGDDHAGKDDNSGRQDPRIPDCWSHGCYGEDPLPGPGDGPASDGPFQFSGHVRPMPTNADFETEPGDLIDVSILLPLRGREREGDQFSNYGNEEIW